MGRGEDMVATTKCTGSTWGNRDLLEFLQPGSGSDFSQEEKAPGCGSLEIELSYLNSQQGAGSNLYLLTALRVAATSGIRTATLR